MSQKSGTSKLSSERIVKDIRRARASNIWPRRRSASCWTVCAASTASRSCAGVKASPRACITPGRRSSWRLASGALRATPRGGDQRRGQGPAPGSPGAEGGRRRAGPGLAPAQKKHDRGWGRRGMRYPASEKLEIIRLVEQSHLRVRRTLSKLGVSRATFYRWCDLSQTGGPEALEDRSPRPDRVWNRIPDNVRGQIVQLALDEPELSPRELATRFTDSKSYFVSEASVYRLLKDHDLIASPAYIVMKAADEFKDKTTAPNQLWQTDFTYLKVIGWGWFYLSTILDDFSRYIIAWKLCTTMKVGDVTETLDLALQASGLDQGHVVPRPRLLSDSGPSSIPPTSPNGWTTAIWVTCAARPATRKHKIERWHQTLKNRILLENYYLPVDLETRIDTLVNHYNN